MLRKKKRAHSRISGFVIVVGFSLETAVSAALRLTESGIPLVLPRGRNSARLPLGVLLKPRPLFSAVLYPLFRAAFDAICNRSQLRTETEGSASSFRILSH